MTTAIAPTRRDLHFRTLEEVLDDVRLIGSVPRRTLGRWTDAQIVQHLAIAVDMSFDGYGFRSPFPIRFIARIIKNRILTGRMPSGVRLPRRGASMLPAPEATWDAAVERLERAIGRFTNERPAQPHPVLGRLTTMEYELLHMRHAELHLSFIVPAAA